MTSTEPPQEPQRLPSREEVRAFLQQLHEKMKMSPVPIVFRDDRDKNRQAIIRLQDLGIHHTQRKEYIKRLQVSDYCLGPVTDSLNPPPGKGDLWIFGIDIRGEEWYVKVQIGAFNASPVCISFHPAQPTPALQYLFKD